MVDRFLVWLGTGVVTAGVTAGMLAGAGVAISDGRRILGRRWSDDLGVVEFH